METETGMYIKLQRIRLGIKQKDLALQAGIMNHRLSEYERGRRNIPPKVLAKLYEVLVKAEEERLAPITDGPDHIGTNEIGAAKE